MSMSITGIHSEALSIPFTPFELHENQDTNRVGVIEYYGNLESEFVGLGNWEWKKAVLLGILLGAACVGANVALGLYQPHLLIFADTFGLILGIVGLTKIFDNYKEKNTLYTRYASEAAGVKGLIEKGKMPVEAHVAYWKQEKIKLTDELHTLKFKPLGRDERMAASLIDKNKIYPIKEKAIIDAKLTAIYFSIIAKKNLWLQVNQRKPEEFFVPDYDTEISPELLSSERNRNFDINYRLFTLQIEAYERHLNRLPTVLGRSLATTNIGNAGIKLIRSDGNHKYLSLQEILSSEAEELAQSILNNRT